MVALARPLRVEKAWHAVSVTLWVGVSTAAWVSIIGSGELETSSLGSCILHILVLDVRVAANLEVS